MNDKLGNLSGLLQATGRVAHLSFLLLDEDRKVVFSTDYESAPSFLNVNRLTSNIRATGKGQSMTPHTGQWLSGVPVQLGGGGTQYLVAFQNHAGHDSCERLCDDTAQLLAHLKQLVEQQHSTYEETLTLTEELNQSYEDLYLFSRIAGQIKTLSFTGTVFQNLLNELLQTLRADVAGAEFPDRPDFNITLGRENMETGIDQAETFWRQVFERVPQHAPSFEENCFIVGNSTEIPAFRELHPDPFRLLAVRIKNGETVYGWLVLISFNMNEIFRRGESRLLNTITEQIALVIANSDLYRDLEEFVINLVKTLVRAIEAKDVYTRGHSERVSQLSMLIGNEQDLTEEDMKDLRWGSVLHDIGKIGIPESILNKPGRLTDEEYDVIKSHPAKGADMLQPITQLAGALPIVRHHHERIDGKGYPDGLSGTYIPFLARMVGIADTYDALTSNRAYRDGLSHEDAMRIVNEAAGTQLDADLVTVFNEIMKNEHEVKRVDLPHAG